ncbi:hypothetical protein DY000_02027768 [Brassica cretica]|uniref:Uncharacterized protein n=1 Tax=Brassica cretica TaxID=69181 RepID=A0ABQ7E150_BRACR|nr:hypothetical protein DY000_02027768 [Brassica cretica]
MKSEMKAPTIPQEGSKKGSHGRPCGPARRSTKGQWTAEEDEVLCKAVERFQGKNWKKIAECFKDRTDVQCLHRWQKVLNPELVKGPWSKEEDDTIIALVEKYGPKKWSTISQHLPGRIGKQCRERWHNHLNPGINKNAWTQEEEVTLIRAHQIYGNKWAELTKFLPGRSDNSIKNHWNSSVKKKLDSYYASGLLDQSQSSPLIPIQNNSIASSSSDVRQEYSPFGIRQLMMNCATPLRLWDSPCRNKSPDVMLKDAAKSFSGTPSFLKKRQHRDLMSPVLDRRKEKLLKSAEASSLAKDFSRLDVMLNGCSSSILSERPDNRNEHASSSEAKKDPKETLESGGVTSAKIDQETRRSLVYCNDVEVQLSSPDKSGSRPDNKVNTTASEPPFTVDPIPLSAIAGNKTNNAESSFDIIENCSIFDGTPFKQLLDTPSPWKSPLLFGSFLQSPRLPPEITFEDIGCFMSPGDRSYDAIGLMKHLSEHTATAYADALEVLGNDTPETILKKRQLNKSIQGKENQHWSHDQLENRSQVECRALDFSDCGTPGKAKVSSASPGSSYLLKSCR